LLAALGGWLIAHPFLGIHQDGRLYALQALATIHPDSIGGDIFLRYASQDEYTFFSPLYGAAISRLGVEDAARLLVAAGQAWWIVAAAWLVRSLTPGVRSWLALLLVAFVPLGYAAYFTLAVGEGFVTPRLYAECITLTALALWLHDRRPAAVALQLIAFAVHPLMAMAGALLLAVLALGRRGIPVVAAVVLAGTALVIIVSRVSPAGPLQPIDDAWLAMISNRTPIVTPDRWDAGYWGRLTLALAVLLLAARFSRDAGIAQLCGAAATVLALGVAVTLAGAWAFPTVLLAQGQAWRWTWLPLLLCLVTAASIVPQLWATESGQRPALLLAAAALLAGPPAGLWLSGAVLLLAALPRSVTSAAHRPLRVVAAALLVVAIILWLQRMAGLPRALLDASGGAGDVRDSLRGWLEDGVLGGLAAWTLFEALRRMRGGGLAVAAGGGVLLLGLWYAAPLWLRDYYSNEAHAAFQSWRDAIPADAEVLWGKDPVLTWSLLERRSFVSTDQTAGAVFSREATMVMRQRASEAAAIVPSSMIFAGTYNAVWKPSASALVEGCRAAPQLDFVVTNAPLGLPESAPVVRFPSSDESGDLLHLYACAGLRQVDPVS
jgi:hypothetical protein